MDLEAVFTMADNVPRPVTDPLGFHVTNQQLLGVDFSFVPVTHASVDRKDASGSSTLDESITLGSTNVQQSSSSALIDSDDDFGDFTSVPAENLHARDVSLSADPFGFPVNTDVGSSFDMFAFHTSTAHLQKTTPQEDLFEHLPATVESPTNKARSDCTASPVKPLENNSDDDWGDFVEHSTSELSTQFDWFNNSQQNIGHSWPDEFVASNANNATAAWESGVWTGPSKVELPNSEQKATNFGFDDLSFFAGGNVSSSKGSKDSPQAAPDPEGLGLVNDEMAAQQKTSPLQRTLSGQKMGKGASSSAPIPLSLFGETELEVENSNIELPDPVTKSVQGHSRTKARSTGSFPSDSTNLSDLIASLYTESQSDLPIKNTLVTNSVDLHEVKDSVSNDNSKKDLLDTLIVHDGSSSLEERMFNLSLSLEHAADLDSFKGNIGMSAGTDLESQEVTGFELSDLISTADRCTFVKAWASLLAFCASELELALNTWKQAQNEDAHLELLADIQGKMYFAAIGQVYVVALILAATSNFYKPWLRLAPKEGNSLQADLQRCKVAWLQTDLKEGVHLALDGVQGLVPSAVLSWEGIEGLAAVALKVYSQAAKPTLPSICRMSLLPLASFQGAGLPAVEWLGCSYLLPLANMWVNCVSHEPPLTLPANSVEDFVSG